MRIIAFFLSFALFLQCAFSDVTLLSMNLAHLKRQGSDGYEDWKSLVCSVIKESKADIVLLQEVPIELSKRTDTPVFKMPEKDNILDDFSSELGGSWLYFSTAAYAIRKNMEVEGESYVSCDMNQNNAVLYNSRRVLGKDLSKTLGFADFSGDFLFDKNNVQSIEFRISGNEKSRFVVINVHLPYNNVSHRERDLKTLERLFAHFKNREGVIVGGDFNTKRADLSKRNFDGVDGDDGWYFDKNFGLKTTLSAKGEEIVFANDYDHFLFSRKINVKKGLERAFVSGKADKISQWNVAGKSFSSGAQIKKSLSDHIPVLITIDAGSAAFSDLTDILKKTAETFDSAE